MFSASIPAYCHVLNPAWVSISDTVLKDYTWTLKDASGKTIFSGIETGTSFRFDVSSVLKSLISDLYYKTFVNQTIISKTYTDFLAKFTIDITNGTDYLTLTSCAVPGGVPDRFYRSVYEAGSDAFKTLFFNTNLNFALTTRTRNSEITILETELIPISFFGYFQTMTIQDGNTIIATIAGQNANITQLYAVSIEALRLYYYTQTGKLINRFGFYTDGALSFYVNIAKSTESRGYSIVFKNSYGVFEEATISGELKNVSERDNDNAKYKAWDNITNKLINRRQRVTVTEQISADMGYCDDNRRLWLNDMLISEECYLKVDANMYECIVYADTLTMGKSRPTPEAFPITIEMVDKSTTIIPPVDNSKVIRIKKIFSDIFSDIFG